MKAGTMVKLPAGPATGGAEKIPDKDGEEPSVPKARKGSAPRSMARAIIIAAVLISLTYGTVSLLTDRYALVPPAQSENAFIYRIDRLTGSVSFCTQNTCSDVANRARAD